uniref:Uncharacterized protein n=1 Tax=Medicago truncatula TaxID=3880 RepID=Q2HSI3_MEDTR|nr:hypothetical protein MtrDRAFT_AC151522g17v2 [Medicago truncatula]
MMNDYYHQPQSIYAPSCFEQHQDKTSHVESSYASNNARTKEPIPSIQKIRLKIFKQNHRVETKSPPIFISTKQNENKRQ